MPRLLFCRRRLIAAAGAAPAHQDAEAVDAVLQSRSWAEALALTPHAAVGAALDDVERGLISPSRRAILSSFLRTAVRIHPIGNAHPDASLALRWAVESMTQLLHLTDGQARERGEISSVGGQAAPAAEIAPEPYAQQEEGAFRERQCGTDVDEALHQFSMTVTELHDGLSLQDVEQYGLCPDEADALLRSICLLRIAELPAGRQQGDERQMQDLLLAGMQNSHWVVLRTVQLFSRPSRRQLVQKWCSTLMVALGGVTLGGVGRIQRLLLSARASVPSAIAGSSTSLSLSADGGPAVQCPLCRRLVLTNRAIKGVCAGESGPDCCVCTEAPAKVCLPCGHLCLCQE